MSLPPGRPTNKDILALIDQQKNALNIKAWGTKLELACTELVYQHLLKLGHPTIREDNVRMYVSNCSIFYSMICSFLMLQIVRFHINCCSNRYFLIRAVKKLHKERSDLKRGGSTKGKMLKFEAKLANVFLLQSWEVCLLKVVIKI